MLSKCGQAYEKGGDKDEKEKEVRELRVTGENAWRMEKRIDMVKE